jgi:hypothetical protein
VSVRITEKCIEVFHKHERVALHQRSNVKKDYTTVREHMPAAHQKHIEWNPARLYKWAQQIGPATHQLIEKMAISEFLNKYYSYEGL